MTQNLEIHGQLTSVRTGEHQMLQFLTYIRRFTGRSTRSGWRQAGAAVSFALSLFAGTAAAQRGPVVTVNGNRPVTLSERLVWPYLRFHVKAVGDRLLVKDKERSVLVGAISRPAA